jgi:glycosyltransferase involved in cell wall biosynthesis
MITSDHEGLPMNLLEAMALEVPVIAHGVGGISAALGGGRFGDLVSKHDCQAYARALLDLVDALPAARQRALDGLAFLRDHYSSHECARRYMALYNQLQRELELT